MLNEEGQVVINVHCITRYDDERGLHVARFPGLGLTARGKTEEEAMTHCKQLLGKFVRSYRSVGQLEKRLVQSGVEWWWRTDYPTDYPEPEYMDSLLSFRKAEVRIMNIVDRYLEQDNTVHIGRHEHEKEHSPLAVTM